MKSLFAFILLTIPVGAHGDIIKCTFTEPFINTTYSMTQSRLTVEQLGHGRRTLRNISFQILGPGQFELWDSRRRVVQAMNLNFNGSDGMSDKVYPYQGLKNGQYGGCTSNFLHAQ